MTGEPRIPRASVPPPDTSALQQPHQDKALLRDTLKARRRALDPADKAAWDARIGARMLRTMPAATVQKIVVVVMLIAGTRALLRGLGIWI